MFFIDRIIEIIDEHGWDKREETEETRKEKKLENSEEDQINSKMKDLRGKDIIYRKFTLITY